MSHRRLATEFHRLAELDSPPDLVHVGNVPIELAAAAAELSSDRTQVLIDVRDLWPDSYVELLPTGLGPLATAAERLIARGWPKLTNAFQRVAGFTALSEPYLDWALERARRERRSADAVVPMAYPVASVEVVVDRAVTRRALGVAQQDIVAVYLGNVGQQSDFDAVIRAARLAEQCRSPVHFVVAGSGPGYSVIEDAAASCSRLSAPGWLDGAAIGGLMAASDVGLVAYRDIKNFKLNVPNKFVEYLAGGLAIACGVSGEMARLTEEASCGFRYHHGNAEELHRALSRYAEDRAMLSRHRDAASDLHRTYFELDAVMTSFADHLESVAEGGP